MSPHRKLARGRAPTYMLKEKFRAHVRGEDVLLPGGLFLRPVFNDDYLPSHVKDSQAYKWMHKEAETMCYTRYGFVVIPNELIIEV